VKRRGDRGAFDGSFKIVTSSDAKLARGRLLIVSAAVLWSLAGVFIKFLDVPPLTIVFYRSFFACLIFTPFVRRVNWQISTAVVLSVVAYSAAITAFVSANKLTSAANAIVLQYTAPMFVFLFSRLVLREKITWLNGLALSAGMIGVSVISFDSVGEPEMAGVLLAFLSGLLFAVYMINLRRTRNINPVYLTWINNAVCSLLLLLVVRSELALTWNHLGILAVMGGLQLGLPYYLFSKGLEGVSLQEASLIALIEPVLNPVWVALVIGEVPSLATLIGGALIVAGLAARYLWPLLTGDVEPAPITS
jgi:drug/metabolite transporter (DMT)-like permease